MVLYWMIVSYDKYNAIVIEDEAESLSDEDEPVAPKNLKLRF